MYMWIPFEVSAKGMKNPNEAGCEVFGFVQDGKHADHNITDGMEKTVQESAVLTKKGSSSSGMVKTQCLCAHLISLKDMAVVRRME